MSQQSDNGGDSFNVSEDSDHKADTMYAVFVTADMPIEIVNELLEEAAARDDDTDLRIIDAATAENLQTTEYATEPPISSLDSPFLNWAPDQVWGWWIEHIQTRPQGQHSQWAYFNFIILDAQSIPKTEEEDPTLLLCSDAPDLSEARDEIRLKTVRVGFYDGLDNILAFETLNMCPSEIDSATTISGQPHPLFMPTDEPGIFKWAPPEVARRNKRMIIMQMEEQRLQSQRIENSGP